MTIYLATFGTAVDLFIQSDLGQSPAVEADDTDLNITQVSIIATSTITATGIVTRSSIPGYKTIFRFNTNNVAPLSKGFRLFPVMNTLTFGWSADVDFVIEIEYTELGTNWNFRDEIMKLLAGKHQVEDPNLSNLQGKRAVRRAGLLLVED